MEKENTLSMEQFEEKIAEAISKGLSKDLNEAVSVALEEKANELGMTKSDRKAGIFPGQFSEEKLLQMSKKQRIGEFIKATFKKDFGTLESMTKALNEGTDTAGGAFVPEEFAAELNRIVEDFGLIRRFARRIPMSSDTMNVPRLTTAPTVTWPGEGAAGTESDPVFAKVQLSTSTAVGLTVASNELLADANVSIVDILLELFAEAIAGAEDEQGLTGTGSPFTGILGHGSVNVVTMGSGDTAFTNVDAEDLRDMITEIKPTALPGAAFIMHREIFGLVQKLKDANNNYLVTTAIPILGENASVRGGSAGTVAGTIWGYPVYLSEKMPQLSDSAISTKFIAFGNLANMWLGDRQQVTLSISDAATVGSNNVFAENESAVRVTERVAIEVGLPDGFSVLRTAAA